MCRRVQVSVHMCPGVCGYELICCVAVYLYMCADVCVDAGVCRCLSVCISAQVWARGFTVCVNMYVNVCRYVRECV